MIEIIKNLKESQQIQTYSIDSPLLFNLNLIGTRTGRLTTTVPNMQSLPHFLRQILVPDDGFIFLKT